MTDNMSYKITLNDIKDRKDVCLNKKLIVSSDSNGIKRRITFYNTEDYYQIKPQNKITNFSFKFNQILVTVIGDNVYAVNSTIPLAAVTKDAATKSIKLNIKNESSVDYVLRYLE